ncbi:hypothetical protein KFL_012590020, partial [Klebsormidium nitens]
MAQLAGRYDDISRIFEGLLSGTRLEATKKCTVAIGRAQIEQASKHGQSLRGHTANVRFIAWSPEGGKVATASADNTCALWDSVTGERLRVLEGTLDHTIIGWNPDGSRLSTGTISFLGPPKGAIWNAATGERLSVVKGWIPWSIMPRDYIDGRLEGRVLSPDRSKLATMLDDKRVAISDAATGERLRVLEGHTGLVHCICWSPDGSSIA